ncbi:threonine/serine exporter family protein [Variovorax dokdonensis]|uniref:Threonine/serine exporter family protein n=1 Tax=Variovorax dokdonensis TaxID=344883 RepID=A0ABT7NEB5_9BURK|nr:threonine/serine exporter family protein [Variovorax dokdonensis]MDM0046292.1 threonine/serine exporter family protein [Variovorax dokdonensis]
MTEDGAPAAGQGAMPAAAAGDVRADEAILLSEGERERISRERRRLLRFLLRLGHLLLATGSPVRLVETTLQRVASVHQIAQFNALALPTVLFVNFAEEDDVLQIEFTAEQGLVLRFDQIEATFELARDAERAPLDPTEGLRRINAILAMPPRYRWQWDLLGHVLATVGIALVLQPSIDLVGVVAFFGLLVGGLRLVARQRSILTTLLPTFSAFVVVLVSLLGAQHGLQASPTYVLIASLLTFLPGGMLAIATVELAYGDMVSGATRFISGLLQLVFLILGMLAAASLVGLPANDLLKPATDSYVRAWAPWLAAVLFGVGHWLHYSATPRALPWMVLVLLIAQAGQMLGNAVFGGYMSGFIAAVLITPASYAVQYRLGGPPATVTFTPALWILVPGSLGLIGMAELASDNKLAGLENFVTTLFSIVAIGLGTVVGTALYNLLFDPVFVRAGNMANLMLRYLRLRR